MGVTESKKINSKVSGLCQWRETVFTVILDIIPAN
ncbi:MAG: hypothetical protein RJB38_1225 [Pseudomonadota bacterium]|jgi:hypothetical protein